MPVKPGAKNGLQAQTDHGPQQPAQVVAGGTQHGMQRIAQLPLKPTTIHPVIRLEMANRRFYRLSSLEPSALLPGQRLVLAAMNDLTIDTLRETKSLQEVRFVVLQPELEGLFRKNLIDSLR